tara:strand:- start:1562 stop:1804 length:243 start_codon:yes stop_codon:yes gene_type:complete
MNKLSEIYNNQYHHEKIDEKPEEDLGKKITIHMPEIADLIKHLNLLYFKMIIQKESENSNQQVSWFNSGQGSKDQSDSVN